MAERSDAPGRGERVKGYAARARQAPNALSELRHDAEVTRAALAELREQLGRLEELAWAIRNDAQAGVAALGTELHKKQHHFDPVLDRLDGAVAAHAAALGRAIAAPARAEAARQLREALGPAPVPRPGLSIFTLCWNHGELLATSVRSALEVLDGLPPAEQGQVLILDDASTDATPAVSAALAAEDDRVRVIRADTNLGLAHARTTLLHAAATSHAFQLDADNTAIAPGVLDLYRVATEVGSALTYGNVVQIGADGVVWGPMSNEPPTAALFASNYVDTMALSDVAAYRALGGWPTDPLLEHVDDWASLHQVVQAGLLVAFVPTVVGRYQQLGTSFHLSVSDPRIGTSRVARVYDPTGRRQGADPLDGVAAVAVHPSTGPLWATPAAVAANPALRPAPLAPAPVPPAGPRVLVVSSGGVANVGDDAITVRGLQRVRDAWGPDVAIDLVTDGPAASPGLGAARWLGPVSHVVRGLPLAQLGLTDRPGPADALLAATAARHGVGTGTWAPLDVGAYDAAVFLGSGLTSLFAGGTIEPRAFLAAALRAADVPYACSGQGYGPIEGDDQQALLAGFVAGAVAVSTRDHTSADLAAALDGVDADRVTVTGDDALGLAPAELPSIGGPEGRRPVIGITLRHADYVGGASAVRRWALAVDAVAHARGGSVLGIALNSQPPEPEIATLAAVRATTPLRAPWHLVEVGPDPRDLVRIVGSVDAMAAQSYHAALFALAAGRPTVLAAATPYYVGKAAGLARLAGVPEALAVADPDGLAAALDAVAAGGPAEGAPLDAARAAVDAWWAALPDRLGAGAPVSG